MRDHIIAEIKRLAAEDGGRPPGKRTFAAATGIAESKWSGRYWARWGDALVEAGFTANERQQRADSGEMLSAVARLRLEVGRVPTWAEMKLRRVEDRSFPNKSTIENHFPHNSALIDALRDHAVRTGDEPLLALLPLPPQPPDQPSTKTEDGLVYLLKSGDFFKIGRSDNVERRIREITVALPEAVTLVHAIRTDDPPGIEAYWHRRFAERRANGEWFRLKAEDVRAFKRRQFQ